MKLTLFLLSCWSLGGCGTKSSGSGITAVGEPCDATFTVTLADGTEIDLGACVHHGLNPGYRHEPTGEILMRDISFIFIGGDVEAENCWVRWDQTGLCNDPYYPFDDETGSLSWSLDDCPGAEGAGAGEATTGYAYLVENLVSFPTGDGHVVKIQANINGASDGGLTLSGSVLFTEEMDTSTLTESTCAGSTGDDDQDTYIDPMYGGDDCDDADIEVHPGVAETCDGIDNDCNGQIDDGVTRTYYLDADGDDWGDEDEPLEACEDEQPSEYVEEIKAQDCDDSDSEIYPGATEECDEVDNNCDGQIDEGC
jgi:hypothetical protein